MGVEANKVNLSFQDVCYDFLIIYKECYMIIIHLSDKIIILD